MNEFWQHLIQLFAEVGQGAEWEEAFKLVFGRTVDEFYAEFEVYRLTLMK